MRMVLVSLLMFAVLLACQSEKSQEGKQLESMQSDGKISSIIRNPVSANKPVDTVNVARIVFEEKVYDFGEVDEGAIVKHVFQFTNEGNVPLLISDARATCGCTVPEWPKEAIEPGASGEISVEFNTLKKRNQQVTPVTITANTYPAQTKLQLRGFVQPAETN